MKTTNELTPELKKAKEEIDNYYKSNELVKLPFATAAWYLLTFAEDMMQTVALDKEREHHYPTIIDNFVNALKEPLSWLYRDCIPGGQVPTAINNYYYKASEDLFKLGLKYSSFVAAYTYSWHGWIKLDSQGTAIQSTKELFTDRQYEAYNRLIKKREVQEVSSLVDFENLQLILSNAIEDSLNVEGNRFSYELDSKMVSATIATMKQKFDTVFSLPGGWSLSRYTLGDFRKVFEVIYAISNIHVIGRIIAVDQECDNYALLNILHLPTCDELLSNVVKFSGIADKKVLCIFDDLSYGNKNVERIDPALQPLVKLNSENYIIMPHLWLSSAAERNLTTLLNLLHSEKKTYSKLVNKFESLMRKYITTELSNIGLCFTWGKVKDFLGNVDLAIISHAEKACLLLELKWLIYPAEIGEIVNKSKKLEEGVSQVLKLKEKFVENHTPLLEKLNVDSSYKLEGVVGSQNWIGHAKIQSTEVPIIQINDLITKLKATRSLQSAIEWLKDRKYLPKEGKDFEVRKATSTIGDWSIEWEKMELF